MKAKEKIKKKAEEEMYVKIRLSGKRIWCKVKSIDKNNSILAWVLTDLPFRKFGSLIRFPADEVIAFTNLSLGALGALGAPYIPAAATCIILDTIVPDSMDFETHVSVRKAQEKIGGLDQYVMKKLKYTNAEMCQALAAEQIDAVAMAIYNIEEKNQGMIIGDQTGIGKGRVAAAMIRYGNLNGHQPIFMSEKANLFSDMYRDLADIGSDHLVPFIVNAKSSKTDVKDLNGNIVYQAIPTHDQRPIFSSGKIPERFQFVMATYSQFRSPESKPEKPNFLRKIARGNIIIMDEAHNASGSSNTGEFMQGVLDGCKGVTFLSATFAKRPDNMPIYAIKTAMRDTTLNKDELVDAIKQGGVALQEVISAQLVAEGQMLRRERSFENVETNYNSLDEHEQIHKAISDNITEIIRDIIAFQGKEITPVIDQKDDIAKAESKEIKERGGTSMAGVDNQPYFSKVFRVIDQLLFSIKASSVADMAIARLKEGKKPLIAFSSTMGAFLENMQTEFGQGVKDGDTINADFKTVLVKGLNGVLRYTETDHAGNKGFKVFKVSELSPEGQATYHQIMDKIESASTGITISPIDVITQKIQDAGLTVAEVTGRKLMVQYKDTEGSSTMGVVLNRKKENTNDAFRRFNNNEVDALMINQSGSTGASAHAITTDQVPPEEVKQRVMIILQAELNVNTEVQKRGRVNRTGQLIPPIYDYVNSAIPAEKRLMMMLQKKLKSLSANAASNQNESKDMLNVDDFLNRIGDGVMADYLMENQGLNTILGDPMKLEGENKEGEKTPENIAHIASGRAAVLSVKNQDQFYREILARYQDQVKYLKQTGEYNLEVEAMNLEAETTDREKIIEGKGGDSVFGQDTILETCQVNVLTKPYTKTELDNLIKKYLDGQSAEDIQSHVREKFKTFTDNRLGQAIENLFAKYEKLKANITSEAKYKKLKTNQDRQEYVQNRMNELDTAQDASAKMEKEKSQNIFQTLDGMFHSFLIGRGYNFPKDTFDKGSTNVPSVFLGYEIDESRTNPYAPSAIKFRFALADSTRFIQLALSGAQGNLVRAINGASSGWMFSRHKSADFVDNWETHTRKSSSNRQQRYIVSGNILQAFGSDSKGKLISFTTLDQSVRKGILMPENWKPGVKKHWRDQNTVIMPIIKARRIILAKMSGGDEIRSTTGLVIERSYYDRFLLIMPKSKAYKPMFTDHHITDLCTTPRDGFNMISNKMKAEFTPEKFSNVIDVLQNKYNVAVKINVDQYDVSTKPTQGKGTKDALTIRAEKEFATDKAKFESRIKKQASTPAKAPTKSAPVVSMEEKAKKIRVAKAKAKARLRIIKIRSSRARMVAGLGFAHKHYE